MTVTEPLHLQSEHEYTLVAFHVHRLQGKILVRSSDTDVLVILLGLTETIGDETDLTMDFGAGNTRRFIDITEIGNALELRQPGLTKALLGLHSLTGCDFTSCFYRKGKAKPLEILEKSKDHVSALRTLITDPNIAEITKFVCQMYGFKNEEKTNKVRFEAFKKMTAGHLSKGMKRINCASLPPCEKVLVQHIKRAAYVAQLWSNATEVNPTLDKSPLDHGWVEDENGMYVPHYYDGESLPSAVTPLASDIDVVEQEGDEDPYEADTDVVDNDEVEQGEGDVWSEDSDSDDDEDA